MLLSFHPDWNTSQRCSTLLKGAMGLGSRISEGRSASSYDSRSDFRRKTMLLTTLAGELANDVDDATSVLLAREDVVDDLDDDDDDDDDDVDRRSEPRRLRGKRRALMDWKPLLCMAGGWNRDGRRGRGSDSREQRLYMMSCVLEPLRPER
ncbi:hypothetical protein VTH06DRAFT_6133 [Thermothelomyces fergusii]